MRIFQKCAIILIIAHFWKIRNFCPITIKLGQNDRLLRLPILIKFHNDWGKIVDFLIIPTFWKILNSPAVDSSHFVLMEGVSFIHICPGTSGSILPVRSGPSGSILIKIIKLIIHYFFFCKIWSRTLISMEKK